MAELYRKKQAAHVEVNRLTAENAIAVALWCGGQHVNEKDPFESEKTYVGLNIATLQGVRRASEGDYIVKLENGGFTVWKAPEFEAMYEKVV